MEPTPPAGWLPAFLGGTSPRPVTRSIARLEKIQKEESERRYRAALQATLDTACPCTPPKRRHERSPRFVTLPKLCEAAGQSASAPNSSRRHYDEGRRMAEVGLDLKAANSFLSGLEHAPESHRLRVAFDQTLFRARCSCRHAFGKACPPKRSYYHTYPGERIRGVTWSSCPHCGAVWPDNPHRMRRGRRHGGGGEEEDDESEEGDGDGKPERNEETLAMLASFHFEDLLPKEAKPPRKGAKGGGAGGKKAHAESSGVTASRRDAERAAVEDALVSHFADIKAIHAHYANQNGTDPEQCLGASAFTVDKSELKLFLKDCHLDDRVISNHEFELMFMRVNWSPEDGLQAPDPELSRANNFADSETELSANEFAHLLLRMSQLRLPPKERQKDIAAAFDRFMRGAVLPHAQRDQLAFLRDALTSERPLRHVLFMFRKRLSAVFRRNCGPMKNDRDDKTSRDHMSLRAFTELCASSGLSEQCGLQLKDVTLVFLQSQNEDFGSFEGEIDNEMDYNEFLEALLRMAVLSYTRTHGRGALASLSLRDVYEPALATVAGHLEAKEIKLDAVRLEALITQEEARMQELRVRNMWETFESDAQRAQPRDAALELYMSSEAVFKRMLEALEKEGDLVAGANRPKKKLGLKATGMTARLGVSAIRKRVANF